MHPATRRAPQSPVLGGCITICRASIRLLACRLGHPTRPFICPSFCFHLPVHTRARVHSLWCAPILRFHLSTRRQTNIAGPFSARVASDGGHYISRWRQQKVAHGLLARQPFFKVAVLWLPYCPLLAQLPPTVVTRVLGLQLPPIVLSSLLIFRHTKKKVDREALASINHDQLKKVSLSGAYCL